MTTPNEASETAETESSTTESNETESASTSEEKPKTFTQSELDEIIGKRLAKYKGYEDLKRKADEFDKIADASKSETERLQGELDKAKEAADSRTTKYQNMLRRSAIISEATKMSLVDPETAYELLMAKGFPGIDLNDEDDTVSGVDKALSTLVKDKPFLKGSKFGTVTNGAQNADDEIPPDESVEAYMRRTTPKNSRLAKALNIE